MSQVLKELQGQSVQVYSVRGETEISDIGILDAFDEQWLCLNKNGAKLFFSIARIRLVKPL